MKSNLTLKSFVCFVLIGLLQSCQHGPSLRMYSQVKKERAPQKDLPVFTQTHPKPFIRKKVKALKTKHTTKQTLKFAKRMLSKKPSDITPNKYTDDNLGAVEAFYDYYGIKIGPGLAGNRTVLELFNLVQSKGIIDRRKAAPMDLVFFHHSFDRNMNGKLDDPLTHVGIVENILSDGTIIFIHFLGETIIRSRLNLKRPKTKHHPTSHKRLNHFLRKETKLERGYTTGELFAGFGRFKTRQ